MIPKKIHYVWLGKGVKNEMTQRCIESWKKYAPDYEIIEWNEENFDISSVKFVSEAYKMKKYAFASDYIRLHAIYNHGGFYMDTDCELKKPLDQFTIHNAVTGFEIDKIPFTAFFGAEKHNAWVKEFMTYYENKGFINNDGTFNQRPNTSICAEMLIKKYGVKPNNKKQTTKYGLVIYPAVYFTLNSNDKNNYVTHHFSATWQSKDGFYKKYVQRRMGSKIAWFIFYKWLYHTKGLISLLKKKK